MTDKEFDDLEAEYEDAQELVQELQIKYRAALADRSPKIGDIVIDSRGLEWRVARVYFRWSGDTVLFKFNQKKKDGSFGTGQRNLYGGWKRKV